MTFNLKCVTGIILSISILGGLIVQKKEQNRQIRWRFKQQSVSDLTFSSNGDAYVVDRYQNVFVFRSNDKNPSREFTLPMPAIFTFQIESSRDILYFGGYDGFGAVECSNSRTKWLRRQPIGTMKIGKEGELYVGKRILEAIDTDTGKTTWTFTPPPTPERDEDGVVNPDPIQCILTGKDKVFVATGMPRASLYALDSRNGSVLWKRKLDVYYSSNITLSIGNQSPLLVSCGTASLLAFDPNTGEDWSQFQELEPDGKTAFGTGGTMYLCDTSGVYARGSRGDLLWYTPVGNKHCSNIIFTPDGTVLVGATPNLVCALDGKTGKKLWEEYLGHSFDLYGPNWADVYLSPDGWVYAVSTNGNAYALRHRVGMGNH